MNQPRYKTPRGQKTMPVTTVAASVQQAIQRDAQQVIPGERPTEQHPVMRAIDLLINYDGEVMFEPDSFNEAGRQLQEYHAEQQNGLKIAAAREDAARKALDNFADFVAEAMEIDLLDTDMTHAELLSVLRDRLNPPTPLEEKPPVTPNEHAAIKNMNAVCSVLARHFEDEPAVTFENAAELVAHVISDSNEFRSQAAINAREREALRDKLRERGGVTSPNPQEAEELEALRETVKALAPLLGLRDDVKDRADLNRIIGKVRSLIENQIPDGFKEHAQTLVDSNKRYEDALAAMRHVLSLV